MIICRLVAPTKVFLQLEHNTDASSVKSISGGTSSGNSAGQGNIDQKGTFLKKEHQKFYHPPLFHPFFKCFASK